MEKRNFKDLVVEMRAAQKAYLKARKADRLIRIKLLNKSVVLEVAVDEAISVYKRRQASKIAKESVEKRRKEEA